MEHYIANTLANQGLTKVGKSFYNKENVDWICKAVAAGNINETLKTTPLEEEENSGLIELFKEIPVQIFIMKLRSNIFRGNFESVKVRMDFKIRSRVCPNINEVAFVMKIRTTEGEKTVRLTASMMEKLVMEMNTALLMMKKCKQQAIFRL